MDIKKKIKAWLRKWLQEESTDFSPKKSRDLKAVSFVSKQPIDGKHHQTYVFQCTDWDNGEGKDISINSFNEYSKQSEQKYFCLHTDEIDGILACLNDLNYFEL